MIYKIDQSGKIEYTSHNTVIAYSNGKKKAILIKAKDNLIKNFLLHDFKRHGRDIPADHIHFHPVGKKCEAHWHSYYVFKGKRKAEIKITAKEVLAEIFH